MVSSAGPDRDPGESFLVDGWGPMMGTTLLTMLGKGNSAAGYRRARYCFSDGSEQETPFFGMALAAHVRAQTLVILGTAGSSGGR